MAGSCAEFLARVAFIGFSCSSAMAVAESADSAAGGVGRSCSEFMEVTGLPLRYSFPSSLEGFGHYYY